MQASITEDMISDEQLRRALLRLRDANIYSVELLFFEYLPSIIAIGGPIPVLSLAAAEQVLNNMEALPLHSVRNFLKRYIKAKSSPARRGRMLANVSEHNRIAFEANVDFLFRQ